MNPNRKKVSDPALLANLGGEKRQKVTDPNLLAQLNGDEEEDDEGAYLDNLPKPEGFWSKLPRNILIGLTHAGRNLHNSPHDIVQALEHGASSFGNNDLDKLLADKYGVKQNKGKPLSAYLPHDTQDYSDVFGGDKDAKTLVDKIVQGGFEYSPELIGGLGLARGGIRRLKGTHQLDKVDKAIKNKGLDNFSYDEKTLREAKKYMPPSEASKEALMRSASGEYPASFSLQSQIGHHQRNLSNSALASERLLAPRVGELKQNMAKQLQDILRSHGMHEEADLLKQGIKNYAQYMRIKNASMPVLKKLGIPTTILAALGFGYKKAKKVLSD